MRNIAVAILTLVSIAWAQERKVVHICVSLDEQHSAKVLAKFTEETGIEVVARYDTEANKTVGLVQLLLGQKESPQYDVYWNNELANTVKLKENGVLEAYRSAAAEGIPAALKDPDGYWTGFAARARVLIINTDLVKPDEMPSSMWDLADPKWKGKVCMARPRTGTTAAHASALYTLDEAQADEYFRKLVDNDLVWLTGNAHCMREVSAGRFAFGWTDTDDFNVARLQGRPVAMVYPDKADDQVGVMYIPNSLMLIKGGPNPDGGRALIDWLLRPEIEEMLAHSATAQIPVRAGVKVPDHVRRPDQVGKTMTLDWDRVGREYDKWVTRANAVIDKKGQEIATAEGGGAGNVLLLVVIGVLIVGGLLLFVLKRATSEPT